LLTSQPEAQSAVPAHPDAIRDELRRLERRDWSLWMWVVVILLLLCLAVLVLSAPLATVRADELLSLGQRETAIRSLFAAIALFCSFAVYQQHHIKHLRMRLADELAISAGLAARAEVLEKLATHDELTGLHNRRFALEQLEAEVERSARYGYPLSLLVLDLDGFKLVNDTHGHAAGDTVLRDFGHWIRRAIRNSDIPVRMGGDEFMVLLPECDLEHAQAPLARMHGCICDFHGVRAEVKFSYGCIQRERDESSAALLARADADLYTCKRRRRSGSLAPHAVSAGTTDY
jgi:diguanylate cyclase (GGDEF)-like protein